MLNEQRRMHPTIGDFVGKEMYGGNILSKANFASLEIKDDLWGMLEENPFLFIDLSQMYSVCTHTFDYSYINLLSAFVTMGVAYRLSEFCKIGIITPYNGQSRLIDSMIQGLELNYKIKCATVHQFQGSEEEIIIFDAVDCYYKNYVSGLLSSNRLMNVAISRAKRNFIFIGNLNFLKGKVSPNKNVLYNFLKKVDDRNQIKLNKFIFENKSFIFSDNVFSYSLFEKYKKDLEEAKKEICMDIYGNLQNTDYIIKTLKKRYEKGIKIKVRFRFEKIPEQIQKNSIQEYSVTNTVTIIDKKIVWYGFPTTDSSFISKNKHIQCTQYPVFRIESSTVVKMIWRFLNLKNGENDEYEIDCLSIDRTCPLCKSKLSAISNNEVRCLNDDCKYIEKIITVAEADLKKSEVLSIYTKNYSPINKIAYLPISESKKIPNFVCLRSDGRRMKDIYQVIKCITIYPTFISNLKESLNDIEYKEFSTYLKYNTNITKTEPCEFYFLKKCAQIKKNFVINDKNPIWIDSSKLL